MIDLKDAARIADRQDASLDRRYGKIGIPAVAAALPYQSYPKNPANAVSSDQKKWLAGLAAA
jgi:hypothetical protein